MPANDDPRNAPSYRAMRAIVIILGVLIALAFVALIWGFIARLSGHAGGNPTGPADFALPQGSKILQVQVTTTARIVMAVQTPQGNEVEIFDTDDGHLIGRIHPK
jgi:hypothetical protein